MAVNKPRWNFYDGKFQQYGYTFIGSYKEYDLYHYKHLKLQLLLKVKKSKNGIRSDHIEIDSLNTKDKAFLAAIKFAIQKKLIKLKRILKYKPTEWQ